MFIPITKIDEEKRLVYGIATAETPDKSGEICDYESTVPYYKQWSSEIEKASDGKSKGNLRVMHGDIVAGTIPQIHFNDEAKQIEICGKVVDDAEWKKVMAGAYTGFSQGGKYIKTWKDGDYTRYTANPCEISLVDNPCLSTATFEVLKADGGVELRKFQTMEKNVMTDKQEVTQGWQAADGSFHVSKSAALAHNESVEKSAETVEEAVVLADESVEKKDEAEAEVAAPAGEADETNDIKKFIMGMGDEVFDAAQAIEALNCIVWLFMREASEEENEPEQLADLQEVISRLKSFIASEIMEGESEDAEKVAKRGAKMSAASKEHMMKMYKSANDHVDCMKECMKSMGVDGMDDNDPMPADKDAKNKKSEEADLQKSQNALQEQLTKDFNEKLSKSDVTIENLIKRLAALEAQPAEAKGAKMVLKDAHESEAGVSSSVEGLLKRNDLSPEQVAKELFKIQSRK